MTREAALTPGRWAMAFAICALVAAFNASETYVAMRSHGHAYWRLLAYQLATWWLWAALTPVVDGLRRRFPPAGAGLVVHGGAALGLGSAHVAAWLALGLVLRPYEPLGVDPFSGSHFLQMVVSRLPIELVVYGVTLVALYAVAAQDHARHRDLEAARLQRELAEARLDALRLQLHPHFLFNALHTIGGLVRAGEGRRAVGMLAGLSDLLRQALDCTRPEVPLRDEIETALLYLRIESERFADRLRTKIEIPPEAGEAHLPPLILQPLIENAIRHGIARLAGGGTIEVTARRDRDMLRVEIANPAADGTPAEPGRAGGGLGLANARRRLREHYGERQAFEIRRQGERVVVTLAVPWHVTPAEATA